MSSVPGTQKKSYSRLAGSKNRTLEDEGRGVRQRVGQLGANHQHGAGKAARGA